MKLPSFFKSRQVGRDSVKKIGMYLAGWPFWLGKGTMEGLLLLSGYVMGGPVGIGTVTFSIVVDGCIQPLMWMNRHLLGFPEYWAAPISCVERNY